MEDRVSARPLEPEDLWEFRVGQLILLFDVASTVKGHGVDLDRLAYYDFFAANPFLVYSDATPERLRLQLAGFDTRSLNYSSSAQRFTNRRRRLQHDLGVIASRGLIEARVVERRLEWSPTDEGRRIAASFTALYAAAYRMSAELVIRTLGGMTDKRLRERSREWLKASDFMIDLYE